MKIRKSTTLMAGACTLCIAAASGTVEPQVQLAAHQESTVRVVSQDYTLAATVDPLAIAQLPFQNYFTIASTLGNLAAFIPPVNAATGAFFQGQWDKIPPLLQKAIADEIAAIGAVIQLPATIIAHDLAVITGAVGGTSSAALGNAVTQSDVATTAAAPADTASGLLAIAQLPFQNYFTIASTLGNLAAFVPPVNAATGAFFQGQWDKIPPLLQKAFTDELAAINNVLQLPATIITTDLAVISGAFGAGLGATALTTGTSSIEMQALTAALSTDTNTTTGTGTGDKNGSGTNDTVSNNTGAKNEDAGTNDTDTDTNDKNGSGINKTSTSTDTSSTTTGTTTTGATNTGTNDKNGSGTNDKNGSGINDTSTTNNGSGTKSVSATNSGSGATNASTTKSGAGTDDNGAGAKKPGNDTGAK